MIPAGRGMTSGAAVLCRKATGTDGGQPTPIAKMLYTVFTNIIFGQQPRGAAFLDGKAASNSVSAPPAFVKTV
jgi:hypothetical protein